MNAYKIAGIIVTSLFVLICLVLVYIFFTRSQAGKVSVRELIDTAKIEIRGAKNCGPIFGSCELELTKESPICNPNELIQEIKKEAVRPLTSANCIEAVDNMKSRCSTGCAYDSSSLITVSGDINIDILYTDPETNTQQVLLPRTKIPDGPCSAVGRRVVNFKASCG